MQIHGDVLSSLLLIAPLDPKGKQNNWPNPSLGILRLAGYLRKNFPRWNIVTHDIQIDGDDFSKYPISIDICGISVLHESLVNTINLINNLHKQFPETVLIVGGIEAATNYQDIFDHSLCNFVVLGQGEEPLADIMRWYEGKKQLEDIDGIVYKKSPKRISNEQYWDYWNAITFGHDYYEQFWAEAIKQRNLSDVEANLQRIRHIRLVTTAGCFKKCTFCSTTLNSGYINYLTGEQIFILVQRVLEQVPDLESIYFVTDDIYFPYKEHFNKFIDLYLASGLKDKSKCKFLIQTSVQSLEKEDIVRLKELGVWRITLGIENCSPAVLKSLNKSVDLIKANQIIDWANKYQIDLYYLIMLFPPESSMEDLWINYIQLNRWQERGVRISIEPVIRAYRGTPIFNQDYAIEYSFKTLENNCEKLKFSEYLLPKDPIVRQLVLEFKSLEESFVQEQLAKESSLHSTKGDTGKILLCLLGQLLTKYNCKKKFTPEMD